MAISLPASWYGGYAVGSSVGGFGAGGGPGGGGSSSGVSGGSYGRPGYQSTYTGPRYAPKPIKSIEDYKKLQSQTYHRAEPVAQQQQQADGDELSALEKANLIVAATNVVPATIEMAVDVIQRSANYTDDIAKVGRVANMASKNLGVISMALTATQGLTSTNGWQNHHTADLIIGGVQTFLIGSGPIGWGVGLAWITADLITQGVTGKSITENFFDP